MKKMPAKLKIIWQHERWGVFEKLDYLWRKHHKMRIEIVKGQTLWEALEKENIVLDRPCGGNGICGACAVFVEGVGNVASCRYSKPGIYEVEPPEKFTFDIVSAGKEKEDFSQNEIAAGKVAIDIGTTTVALMVFTGTGVVTKGFINPQRNYGSDVASRIKAANEGLLEQMQQSIIDQINKEFATLDFIPDEIIVSANTTMQHILKGMDCSGLGKAPFTPSDISLIKYKEPRISGGNVNITLLPGISAFIGADIVSGLYYLKILDKEAPQLFIDLGTNGEMALGDKNGIIVTSTAAGPAFEGSSLALKVHAAGVIKALSYMLKNNIIDEYGTLIDEYFETGYPVSPEICGSDESFDTIYFTQDDIRELQMAKAAIRAGIEMMLKEKHIKLADVSQIYLAGGMGKYIDPTDTVTIGLLPEGAKDIEAVGNSSLHGACAYLKEPEEAADYMHRIVKSAKEIILANQPDFEEMYINYINFQGHVDK